MAAGNADEIEQQMPQPRIGTSRGHRGSEGSTCLMLPYQQAALDSRNL